MAFSSEQVWAKFYEKLVQTAVPNFDKTKQVVSVSGTTLSADIVNADPDISNANIYNIGNLLPAASASYAPGGDLITSYALFLQNIDLGGNTDPALVAKINVASANVNSNQSNFTKVQSEAYTQYSTYKTTINPGYTGDFDTWANANYPVYASAKSSLNGAIADYDGLMVEAHGAGYSIIEAAEAAVSSITGAKSLTSKNSYNMPVKVGSVAPAGGTPVLPGQDPAAPVSSLTSTFRPAFSVGGGLNKVLSAWQTESVNKNFPVSFSLSGNFADGNYRDFGWSEAVSASYRSWFSVKVNQQASYQSVNQDWKQSSFDCKISFNGVQSFPINPSANWFSSGIIQNFKDKLLKSSPQFFGDGGSLNIIPSSIILGYGLKITITVDNASYTSLKTAFQQSASVSVGIGPFSFSGSESSHLNTSSFTYNDDSNTIEINPGPTNVPFLLGVVSNKY
ncbi:hypothetical protein [Pontimicrobium sp. SW4]|uniref:Uncharacterized protein n=1 Tax=Pontimicrobium sp. SW4 TaxID=3153519 RepID=A0AAU7BNV3_9FLAO